MNGNNIRNVSNNVWEVKNEFGIDPVLKCEIVKRYRKV